MSNLQNLPYVSQVNTIIAVLETTPGSMQRDPVVLDMIEHVVNEAFIENAQEDLRVILDQHAVLLRQPTINLIAALLAVEDEILTYCFESDEVTGVYEAIPVEVDEEVTLKYAIAS